MVTHTYNLNWTQYEMACQIYESVGQSPFTANIAASILQCDQRKWGSRFFALRNAGAIEVDHRVPRKNAGSVITWYRFTDTWVRWKAEKEIRDRQEVQDGMAVHAE